MNVGQWGIVVRTGGRAGRRCEGVGRRCRGVWTGSWLWSVGNGSWLWGVGGSQLWGIRSGS